jgi:hypothetical protein
MMEVACGYAGSGANGWFARRSMTRYRVGNTINVNIVAETKPPMMTMASGRCVSEPMPCDSAIGKRPSMASSAVINTVRRGVAAPGSRSR